ncbi:MAG: hypothetical protein RL434_3130 [Pseudomonadota bacterium]|jgi:uncharacterized protein YigA (DUF484 family)
MSAPDPADRETLTDAENVRAFLQRHPAFFTDHPELLSALVLPHDAGGAVSLVERQVLRLREENRALKAQAESFLESARGNERLISKIHALTLALMSAKGPRAVIDLLARGIAEDFGADRVTLLVFAEARRPSRTTTEFVGRESPRRVPFESLIHSLRTHCGGLDILQMAALFDGSAFEGSHVLLPLRAAEWDGVLAISSHDPARFNAQLATDFLAFLRDVLTLLLSPWVAPRA